MNTSKLIKLIRSTSGLTQSAFSEITGVSQARISEWETGKKSIRFNTVSQICEKVGLEFSVFVSKV